MEMMGRPWLVFGLVLGACHFEPPTGGPGDLGPDAAGPPGVDGAPASGSPFLFAVDSTTLYRIDMAGRQAVEVGPTQKPGGSPIYIEGLSYRDGRLWALPNNADEKLYEIDPATGTIIGETDLADDRNYWGMTAIPGANPMLVAATDAGELWEISANPRLIGSFTGGLQIAGDITWDAQLGLVATVRGGTCSNSCLAVIDPANANATILASDTPADLWALSSWGGTLYALGGSGTVYSVDRATGAMTSMFVTVPSYSDAAP